jgi:putative endonuclease
MVSFIKKHLSQPLSTKQIGDKTEAFACEYLTKQGLVLVEQNYQSHVGEIDLIMKDKESYVFIEVRLRRFIGFASALESVTLKKQRKIIKTASLYLQQHHLLNKVFCRFDVVAIDNKNKQTKLRWIKHAFSDVIKY